MTHREPWPIPEIPGQLVDDPSIYSFLSSRVAQLCGVKNARFPGSQPVSFTNESLERQLMADDFWVCEKSDGVRVLLFIVHNSLSNEQEVFLIDRKQEYRLLSGIHFPHWESRDVPLTDTIMDGELVYDIHPRTRERSLNYYAFDALVVHGTNIMEKSLLKRYGRLREWIIAPFDRALKDIPEWRESLPMNMHAKRQELSYHLKSVIENHIPNLHHGSDGLIFTSATSPYVAGTDEKIIKWKEPSENSVDFRLELRFPPTPHDPSTPDYHAKPVFLLNVWQGGNSYKHFDELEVDDEEWEEIKNSGKQIDDTVIECYWDPEREGWRKLRERTDKEHGNHKTIVDKILISIADGVSMEELLARTDSIRSAWKAREASRSNQHPKAAPQPTRHTAQPMPPTPGAMASVGPVTPGLVTGLKR